jgi:hypothetical protein
MEGSLLPTTRMVNGFTSDWNPYPNLNGFIASVAEDGGCGEIFHRNDYETEVFNHPSLGPVFWEFPCDLAISNNCHLGEYSSSRLGSAYGRGPGLNQHALFGQERFRVVDYSCLRL